MSATKRPYRTSANRRVPDFTDEQRAWLADMLIPGCCHTSGSHDPQHFDEGRYVCNLQTSARYTALRRALGLPFDDDRDQPRPPASEAVSEPGCYWCGRQEQQ